MELQIPLFNKVIAKLQELYPDIKIVLWQKDGRGAVFVDDHSIVKNLNLDFHEKLLSQGGEEAERNALKYLAEYIETRYIRRKKVWSPLKGRKKLNFTENQIRYAIANTKSNCHAARFLNTSVNTYRKYAEKYGLYKQHLNKGGRGIPRARRWERAPLEDVFAGKYPKYHHTSLKVRLIREHVLINECCLCGEKRQREEDGQMPLLLDYIDGNHANFARENLRLICYNCAFLTRGFVHLRLAKRQRREMLQEFERRNKEAESNIKDDSDKLFEELNKK